MTHTDSELFNTIVNAPFQTNQMETALLFLGIIVLLLVNKETGQIDRVALSNTELAHNTETVSAIPFIDIKIALNHRSNTIAQAIATGEPQQTTDWKTLFTPALTAEQARINQASGGIAYSAVYPLQARDGGALIFSYFQYSQSIGRSQSAFMERYRAIVEQYL